MKNIVKKLSYITKAFLAIGLLFNSLSPAFAVFADELGETSESSIVEKVGETNENKEENDLTTGETNENDEENNVAPSETNENDEENNVAPGETNENDEENNVAPGETNENDEENNVVPGEKNENDEENNVAPGETNENDEENDVAPGETNENDEENNVAPGETTGNIEEIEVTTGETNENVEEYGIGTGEDSGETPETLNENSDNEESSTELFGDINNDGEVNDADLALLVGISLGEDEPTENSDLNGDGVVDTLDVMCLQNTISTYGEETEIVTEEVTIDSNFEDITEEIQSGKEFDLKFIVTLKDYSINGISGLINYDKSMLTLVSAEAVSLPNGELYNDKFLYYGENLELTEEITYDEEGNEIVNYTDTNYVMVILTFKPIQSGNVTVTAEDLAYYNGLVYYTGSNGTSIDITIKENTEEEQQEEQKEEETTTKTVKKVTNKNTNTNNNKNNNKVEDEPKEDVTPAPESEEEKTTKEDEGKISRIVTIILILLVIAGLIYIIFKDDDDDETKKANKEIDKLKKEDEKEIAHQIEPDKPKTTRSRSTSKTSRYKNTKKDK